MTDGLRVMVSVHGGVDSVREPESTKEFPSGAIRMVRYNELGHKVVQWDTRATRY